MERHDPTGWSAGATYRNVGTGSSLFIKLAGLEHGVETVEISDIWQSQQW